MGSKRKRLSSSLISISKEGEKNRDGQKRRRGRTVRGAETARMEIEVNEKEVAAEGKKVKTESLNEMESEQK